VGAVLRSNGHLTLIAALKKARLKAGLTQEEVASLVGRTQSFIAKIESGERRIDVVELIVLTRILQADAATLISTVQKTVPSKQKL